MIVNAIGEAIEFIYGQKEKEVIRGVITKNNKLVTDDFEKYIDNQMFNLRVIGDKIKTT